MLGLIAMVVSSLIVSIPFVLIVHASLIVALIIVAVGVLVSTEFYALCRVAS